MPQIRPSAAARTRPFADRQDAPADGMEGGAPDPPDRRPADRT